MTYFFLMYIYSISSCFVLKGKGIWKKNCIPMLFFFREEYLWCLSNLFSIFYLLKSPLCGFWLIIEGYIVFLFEFVSLFISGCCLATIYPNTTSPLIPIHVIILKCLVSSAKETWFVDMCLKQCELWYEIKLSHIYSFLNGLTSLDCAGVSPPPGQ